MADPWLKFYPQDWRADERLRNCGLAARGLWIEMLALMHRSERYGYLLINGKSPTDRQLAVQVGSTPDEVSALLDELETEAVFSRDRKGAIYSRRMIRDEKKAVHARKIGKKGGNPKLGKQTTNSEQDNPTDNQEDNVGDKPQIPDTRSQKPEYKETSSNEDSSVGTDPPLTENEVIEAWNGRMVAQGFPAVRKLTGTRKRQLKARLRENSVEEWQQALDALERSAFCRGENDRGWKADFDFLLQPKSFTKLLEGAYDG